MKTKKTNPFQVEIEAVSTARANFRKVAEETLRSVLQKTFEKNPNLFAICWRQGTPSFNDGNPCRFSLYSYAMEVHLTHPKNLPMFKDGTPISFTMEELLGSQEMDDDGLNFERIYENSAAKERMETETGPASPSAIAENIGECFDQNRNEDLETYLENNLEFLEEKMEDAYVVVGRDLKILTREYYIE